MSGQHKALLVDIGNSRIKYALCNEVMLPLEVQSCYEIDCLVPHMLSAESVYVSSVGESSVMNSLVTLCRQQAIPLRVIKTEAKTMGITCAYKNFSTLGVDRWLAILAARAMTEKNVAVIDLGTANTCDIVVGDNHLGGWISPGFSVMRESLINKTQEVFADNKEPVELEVGRKTEDCVSYGCLASQSGFVMIAEHYLADRYDDYLILVTGGGQKLLSLVNVEKVQSCRNLVLTGLSRFI